jgi:hypothetical protein
MQRRRRAVAFTAREASPVYGRGRNAENRLKRVGRSERLIGAETPGGVDPSPFDEEAIVRPAFFIAALCSLAACGDGYPLADLTGNTLSFVSASANGATLTSTNQDVDGVPVRLESAFGFTFQATEVGARDRLTGMSEVNASLVGELMVFVNDSGGSLSLAIDFLAEGQRPDCGSHCVHWIGEFQEQTAIDGTAIVNGDTLELRQFRTNHGNGLTLELTTGLVMNGLTLTR